MTDLPYTYSSQGRRPVTLITTATIWALLFTAYALLDASAVILALLGAFTLPAIYDLAANPRSSFTLDATHLRWTSGRQRAEIRLSQIDHLRLDTRLDMSVRLSIVRPSGVKIRVPYPATPPHAKVEEIARTAGLKTVRHHFSLLG
jgi:hypothetical protein